MAFVGTPRYTHSPRHPQGRIDTTGGGRAQFLSVRHPPYPKHDPSRCPTSTIPWMATSLDGSVTTGRAGSVGYPQRQ